MRYFFDKNNTSNDVAKGNTGAASKPILFTAYPDSVGGYQVDVVLHPIQFDYGIYTANAVHPLSGTSESLTFEIKSAQSDIVTEIESQVNKIQKKIPF